METSKQDLRQRMQVLRNGLTLEYRQRSERQITRVLEGLALSGMVLSYQSVRGEVDLQHYHLSCPENLLFPKVAQGTLLACSGMLGFQEGAYGIWEPVSAEPREAWIVLCPGLAFDARGTRLGYGRGYYDRYLAANPSALRVGVAFHAQMRAHVPHDTQDVPMDWMVTEKGVFVRETDVSFDI